MDAAGKGIENEDTKTLREKEMRKHKEVSNGKSYHMNSGEGPYSYAKYSRYQVLFSGS